jgi:hypothetical protein
MPDRFERMAEQADIDAAEDLPDGADDVPRNQQRQRHQHEADRHASPFFGMLSAMKMPSGISIARMISEKARLRCKAQRPRIAVGCSVSEPVGAGPEELVVPERVLHRVVDHRHQRDDRREGDEQQHRQHQKPGFVVPGLVHGSASLPTRQEFGVDVDGCGIEGDARLGRDLRILGHDDRDRLPGKSARTIFCRPISSTRLIVTAACPRARSG